MNEAALAEALTYHRVGLERYSSHVLLRIAKLLARVEDDMERQIRDRLGNRGGELDPTSERLQNLLKIIRDLNAEAQAALRGELTSGMVDAAKHEADWSREAYTRALGAGFQFNVPSAATLRSLVTSRPFQGRFLKDWAAGLERATLDRVKQQILIGITEGEGIDQMIRRLRGTRAASFKDGVFEINRRSAEMVVRTAVNHVTNAAHNATLQENIQLFPRYRWVSVLDGRTSPICRARAGQIYETGKGPVPPGHPNCRSTIVGVPRGSKRESELAYDAWLRRQPGEVVKDILGPTKAKLFLDGELKIDRFVNRAGEELTLVEIQKREAEAWARAGLQRHI